MIRRLACILVLSVLLLSASVTPGMVESTIRVFVHGQPVFFPDQQPVIVNDRTLVPIRGVFEALGATVKWDADAFSVTVQWRGNQAAVFIGSTTAWVNGYQKVLDVAPRIIGDRTMVPLRFLAESLGLKVDWYERYRAVVIGERPALPVLAPADNPNMVMPCTIRVAVRAVPTGGRQPLESGGYEVKEVELSEYVVRVLAHEFGDFTDDKGISHYYTAEPLKAGAIAIVTYAWAYAWNPAQPDYDLDNSTNFQVYIPNKPYEQKHVDAVRAVWGIHMFKGDAGSLFAPQHGSGWYNGRSQATDWMNQRGALYISDTMGYSWDKILRYYYQRVAFHTNPRPCTGLQ